ncbi:hypothetical protein Tco_0558465 [Tanacetum coccineum]
MRDEANVIRSCIARTTAVIAELQAMEDQDEVHDSLLAAKDAKRGEKSKLLALHEVINKALEEIESQRNNVEILDVIEMDEFGLFLLFIDMSLWRWSVGNEFLTMAALYILDKLSEVANSSRLEDKMKVVFSRVRDIDESFIDLLHELCSTIRVSITKDRRLIAELEALGQRVDVLKPLEYMRGMVAQDPARVGLFKGVALMKRRNMTVLVHFISSLFNGNVKVDFAVIWGLNLKNPDTGIVDAEMFLDSECAS